MEASKIQKKKKKGAGMENINSKLALTMKSGKANLGYKATIKSLRQGKCAPHRVFVWPSSRVERPVERTAAFASQRYRFRGGRPPRVPPSPRSQARPDRQQLPTAA